MEKKKEDEKESPIPILILLGTITLGMVSLVVFLILGK